MAVCAVVVLALLGADASEMLRDSWGGWWAQVQQVVVGASLDVEKVVFCGGGF